MKYAAVAPLFDRLVDEDLDVTDDPKPVHFLSLEELQESIIHDLSDLLNTRLTSSWQRYVEKVVVPYSYGTNIKIPTSPDNAYEIQELEETINQAIRDFEPRLIDAHAKIVGIHDPAGTLSIVIDAIVVYKERHAALSFPMVIPT